jgi:cellulose synthase operon protein C
VKRPDFHAPFSGCREGFAARTPNEQASSARSGFRLDPRSGRLFSAAFVAACLVFAGARPAAAVVWPTEVDQIVQRLESAEPEERRAATSEALTLPRALAAPLVRKSLEDPDVDVRIAASTGVLALRLDDVGDQVLGWLNEPDARIRAASCGVLRLARTKASVGPLGRVLSDGDATVRAAAAGALGYQGASDAVVPLLGHLDDPSIDVRLAVIEALHRLGDPRAVLPLAGKVSDGAPEVRRAVVRALGSFRDPAVMTALLVALRDANQAVKIEALTALAAHGAGAETMVLAVVPSTERASPPPVRRAALATLGAIGTDRALTTLLAALEYDEAGVAPARDALVSAGPKAVPPLLRVLANPPTPRSAEFAAGALGHLHAKSAAPALLDALRSGVLPAPVALRAFALVKDPSLLPPTLERLQDSSPTTRLEARRAAEALLDPTTPDGRAVDPLTEALADGKTTAEDRVALASLLGRTGSPRALAALAPLAQSKERSLRLAALSALGQLGVAGQDEVLLEAFGDRDALVRARAGAALGSSCSEATTRKLVTLALSADEQDRSALAAALAGGLGRAAQPATFEDTQKALKSADFALRDALLEGLGKAAEKQAPAASLVLGAARSRESSERRKAAEALAGVPGADARAALRTLVKDYDAGVRANAAWSLGEPGEAGAEAAAALGGVLEDPSTAVSANALIALGRLAARGVEPDKTKARLCGSLADPRAYVRSAALTALRLVGARCEADGVRERSLLSQDPSPVVRAAAADLLGAVPTADPEKDQRARSQCHAEDPFGAVAVRCGTLRPLTEKRDAVTVLVVPAGKREAEPGAPFAVELPDGTMRHGFADRRGAVFVRDTPRGVLSLAVPAPFVK